MRPGALRRRSRAARAGACTPSRHRRPATTFQRDRDRIIHSTAFRRLAHKTQVFVYHEGDHFRTRLTHTIEVAQIARALARALRLDDELAEAVALGHDLGHTPFGHTGEDALDACMARVRRLRPQQPRPAPRHRAGAALRRFRRAQPDPGDARGPGQAQRPADRRRGGRSSAGARAACPRRSSIMISAAEPRSRLLRQPRGAGGGDRRRHRL